MADTMPLDAAKSSSCNEDLIVKEILSSKCCAYQIAFKFGVSPKRVREVGEKCLGKDGFYAQEELLLSDLRKVIAELLLSGKSQSYIIKELGVSKYAFAQLSKSFFDTCIDAGSFTTVIDDSSIDQIGSPLKSVSIKYLDFELSFTTELNPEQSILTICQLLIGGNNHVA